MNKLPADPVLVGNRYYVLEDMQVPNPRFNGLAYPEHAKVLVDKDLQPRFHLEITLHELLHVIWANYNIEDEDAQERTVSQMAAGLTQVLVDNPELLSYIQRQVK